MTNVFRVQACAAVYAFPSPFAFRFCDIRFPRMHRTPPQVINDDLVLRQRPVKIILRGPDVIGTDPPQNGFRWITKHKPTDVESPAIGRLFSVLKLTPQLATVICPSHRTCLETLTTKLSDLIPLEGVRQKSPLYLLSFSQPSNRLVNGAAQNPDRLPSSQTAGHLVLVVSGPRSAQSGSRSAAPPPV